MSVDYTSEKFTRSVILRVAKTIPIPKNREAIERGSKISSDFSDRENYFKFGAGLFMLIGFAIIIVAILSVALTLFIHGPLGLGFFLYYAPGLMVYCIGITLSMKERKSSKKILVHFDRKSLLFSCLSGALMAVFVTSFSVLNYLEYLEVTN